MKREIRCAVCQRPATDHGPLGDSDYWQEPYCDGCERPLTIEGLVIEKTKTSNQKELLRELGKSRAVIFESASDATPPNTLAQAEHFLRKIFELKQQSRAEGKVIGRQQYLDAQANLPLTAARFRRWFRESHLGRPIEVSERRLASLARELLSSPEDDYIEKTWDRYEAHNERALELFGDYEFRMSSESPLIVKGRLPSFVRDLVYESQDAYRWGLSKAATAGCRMAIDALIVEVAKVHFAKLSATTQRRVRGAQGRAFFPSSEALASLNANCLIDELPDACLNTTQKARLKKLRDDCNSVIHGRTREGAQKLGPLDKSAWRILRETIQLLSITVEQGGLTV